MEHRVNCVLFSIDSLGAIFKNRSFSYRVSFPDISTQDGSPYPQSSLTLGLPAVLKVRSGHPTKAVISAPVPDLRNDYSRSVKHFSKPVFPLQFLIEESGYSQQVEQSLQLVEIKCPGFRKCNAGDEGGFWSVFALALLEHFARSTTPLTEVQKFIQLVDTYHRDMDYVDVLNALTELENLKQGGGGGMAWINERSQVSALWYQLRRFLHRYACEYLRTSEVRPSFLGELDQNIVELILLEDPSSDLGLKLIAYALQLKLILYDTTAHPMKSKYAPELPGQRLPLLFFLKDNNLYYTLYTHAQLRTEGYDLSTCSLHPATTNVAGYGDALYTNTKPRFQLSTSVHQDVKSVQVRNMTLARFNMVAQEVISESFNLIRRKGASSSFFSNTDLVPSTLLFAQEFTRCFTQILEMQATDTENHVHRCQDYLAPAPLLKAFQNEATFQHMGLCSYDGERPGELVLNCTHQFCRECLLRYIQSKENELLFIVYPNGEPVNQLTCPKHSCYIRMSKSVLIEVVGDEKFAQYLRVAENITNQRLCDRCGKIRTREMFLVLCECKNDVCVNCYCDLYRRNDRKCSCGRSLERSAVSLLRSVMQECGMCRVRKSLLTDFSAIECDGHMQCQDCLIQRVADKSKCNICYSSLTYSEIQEIESFTERICALCGRQCDKTRLSTMCGCVICIYCAIQVVIQTQQCTTCPVCRAPLSKLAYTTLIVYMTTLNIPKEFVSISPSQQQDGVFCASCTHRITDAEVETLQCNHSFHRFCFESYIQAQLAGQPKISIPCPNCPHQILEQELQTHVSVETFQMYVRNAQRGDFISCLQCHGFVSTVGESGTRLQVILCQNCGFQLCTACNREAGSWHDEKMCRFTQVQDAVEAAEARIKADESVSQCPECKLPALVQSSATQVIKCGNLACQTLFCPNCSVAVLPIWMHGNAWHRPSCKFYDSGDQGRGMNQSCKECVDAGRQCSQPRDLEVPRRFAFHES